MPRSPTPSHKPEGVLRRGWTTGACATAATRAAYTALLSGAFPDPVTITLPRGERPCFALATQELGEDFARAGIIKDAGDDPDVTHQALINATVRRAAPGSGVRFAAGAGVGTVSKAGLPLAIGEPAINPVPRQMMRAEVAEVAGLCGATGDVLIEISVRDGAALAANTWNPRLGIVGGLSILGTTGVVIPYSCSAWIASIHRGIDVARANGFNHLAGCTGNTSEAAVQKMYALADEAMLDMGDFVGGMLKYLRTHPVARITIGGGFAKLAKLALGHMDLHSGRSTVDRQWLAARAVDSGASSELAGQIINANTAAEALSLSRAQGIDLARIVAVHAKDAAQRILRCPGMQVEVVVVDRQGEVAARTAE
ncbi:MAG: cobalt-precorrin-5B (C(1))-methyltransferase [Gammaproteobacteria bacterium]|nr:cobalt-precorrin-5B (C(1))-methyltransferase [Gammaproteobacteria bacterium]